MTQHPGPGGTRLIQVIWRGAAGAQTSAIEKHSFRLPLESMMKTFTLRRALLLAALLAAGVVAGCADVHQDPASSTITGQPDGNAAQAAAGQPASPTNVPF